MDADTGHNGWLVLEAHGGQVQTAMTRHDTSHYSIRKKTTQKVKIFTC